MIDKRKEFLEVLFDSDDYVAFGKNDMAASRGEYPIPEWYTTEAVKFCINPLGKGQRRNGDNIGDNIYSFLFEMDKDDNDQVIPAKEQIRMFVNSGIPYTTMTYSGGKSIHVIIRFTEPITNKWFKSWWEAMNRVLVNKGLPIDPATCKIPQLSRVPNSMRDVDGKLVCQKLININKRIEQSEMLEWLQANGEEVLEPYVPPVREYNPDVNAEVSDEEKFKAAYNMFKKTHGEYLPSQESGNWMNLFNFGVGLYKVDLTLNASIALVNIALGTMAKGSSGDFYTELAIDKGWKDAERKGYEKIQVTTAEQYKENMRAAKETKGVDMSQLMAALDDVPKTFDSDINNYIWSGPDIFLVYPNGDRIKYNTQGFNARFGAQHLKAHDIERKYSSDGYYPDYFNDAAISDNKYNIFKKPDCKIEEGAWPMTKILLEHIFGEQYELGLEYYWVKRHRPTQALPAIGLVGGEDSGKTTIGNHQQMVFGNMNKGYMHQLEKEENAFALNCQDIILEESNAGGTNKNTNPMIVVNKIKDMVTSTGFKIPSKKLYDNAGESPYFAKIMLFTNDMTPLQMDGEATRFWIRKIGKPQKHVGFEKKLGEEVGAFLYYLDNQYTPSRTESAERLWFHPDEYYTVAKGLAKDESAGYLSKRIKGILIDFFDDHPEEEVCYFDLKSIMTAVCAEDTDTNCNSQDVEQSIVQKLKLGVPAKNRKSLPDHLSTPLRDNVWAKRKMRYWAVDKNMNNFEEVGGIEDLDNAFKV